MEIKARIKGGIMKPMNFNKKLVLKKNTITNLDITEMNALRGGENDPETIPASHLIYSGCLACPTYTCVPSNCSGLYCC